MPCLKCLTALLLVAVSGFALACPETPADQSKSTQVEKPLAPKPAV